ncbi:Oxidoreductase NAD-binding domain-containing protein 1 [Apodemus speciosus]|uniref:Oxidoreductase NAD-binding domain-containing protein 1 n=1 Tax=Apodemus speciosus TaxID=105296 RepID=A0ABQ0FHG6_APOSI
MGSPCGQTGRRATTDSTLQQRGNFVGISVYEKLICVLAGVNLEVLVYSTGTKILCQPVDSQNSWVSKSSICPGSTMAHVVLIPGLSRGSAGAICTQAALWGFTASTVRHLTLASIMKSRRKTDHLERTASVHRREVGAAGIGACQGKLPTYSPRQEEEGINNKQRKRGKGFYSREQRTDISGATLRVMAAAKVCEITHESPSVKSLRLLVADKDFSFKAGQWVDFFIPGVSVVGGFSICSSPQQLERERIIELAVKYTDHPPAVWVHSKCTLDSEVALRVGGEFFFDPQPTDAPRNLVLIAGGVGINPLLSILRHSADLHRDHADKGSSYEIGTIKLFYSAKNTNELLFKLDPICLIFQKDILNLVHEFPEKITCSFHVTKQIAQISAELKPYVTDGRITEKEIRDHISAETLFFVCGPPPMTDFFSKHLESHHVPKEHICFEKWW